jgi:hypothetical protein
VTVTAKPRKARVICWIAAPVMLGLFVLIATGLHGSTGDGPGTFQRGDSAAMIGLGVLAALGILLFTRPRLEADETGVRVRNVLGSYDLQWELIRGITFGRGAPWLTLELQDDDVVAVMAVQAADKEYAVKTVRAMRALHARHKEAAQQASASADTE